MRMPWTPTGLLHCWIKSTLLWEISKVFHNLEHIWFNNWSYWWSESMHSQDWMIPLNTRANKQILEAKLMRYPQWLKWMTCHWRQIHGTVAKLRLLSWNVTLSPPRCLLAQMHYFYWWQCEALADVSHNWENNWEITFDQHINKGNTCWCIII